MDWWQVWAIILSNFVTFLCMRRILKDHLEEAEKQRRQMIWYLNKIEENTEDPGKYIC
jgi:hypothetical protein